MIAEPAQLGFSPPAGVGPEGCRPLPFARLPEGVCRGLEPWARADPFEWVPDNVMFPAASASTPSLYDFSLYPWVRGPWEALVDPEVRNITLVWGTQLGKTALEIAYLAYLAANDPCPVLIAGPDQLLCKGLSTTRLYPVLRASPQTRRLLPPEHRQRDLLIDLLWMHVYFGWSGSPATLGEKSCKVVILMELDKWTYDVSREADPAELAKERTKDFLRPKIIADATPTEEGTSRIWAAYQSSDRRTFRVPCPHCGEYQALEWERLELPHTADGRLADPQTCEDQAHYPCRNCKRDIEDQHKPEICRRGVWAAEGQQVDRAGRRVSGSESGAAGASPRSCPAAGAVGSELRSGSHAGFQLSSLYSLKLTWGQIAAKWSAAQGSPGALQNFDNSWLARPFTPKARFATEDQVLAHRGLEAGLGYARDTCPELPLLCLLTVDVQEDCLWYTVWAWCSEKRKYLLRYGQLPADLAAALSVAGLRYKTADAQQFGHTHCLIDSGHRTDEVYAFCAAHGFKPTKGFDSAARIQPIKWSKIGGLNLLGISVLPFKDDLARQIESTELTGPGCWRLPADTGLDFARQLTAEKRIVKRHPITRQAQHIWVKTRDGNHYWDCTVIAAAAALACEWEGTNFYAATNVKTSKHQKAKSADPDGPRVRGYKSGEIVRRLRR